MVVVWCAGSCVFQQNHYYVIWLGIRCAVMLLHDIGILSSEPPVVRSAIAQCFWNGDKSKSSQSDGEASRCVNFDNRKTVVQPSERRNGNSFIESRRICLLMLNFPVVLRIRWKYCFGGNATSWVAAEFSNLLHRRICVVILLQNSWWSSLTTKFEQ
jgi:hypothetical protein